MKPLWPWNKDSDETKKLEAAGRDSAYGVIIVGISIAVGIVAAGVAKLISIFRDL